MTISKVADLHPASYNPRKISERDFEELKTSMKEFGDLSGIVRNVRTGNLVGGHQRIKALDPEWKIFAQPNMDDIGTMASGYIQTEFGRWAYREVDWDEEKEKFANIAANKHGGEWDFPLLKDLIIEIDSGDVDLSLTGFDQTELSSIMVYDVKEPSKEPSLKAHEAHELECPACGHRFKPTKGE